MVVDPSAPRASSESRMMLADRREVRLIVCLLLVLATLAIFSPLSRAPFLNFDDNAYVYENFHVRQGLSWNTLAWAFTTTDESNWHPLTWLSHALDAELFGLKPAGPHYVNLLIHAANVVLLFLLLQRGTGKLWRSVAVAFLFAVHPLNVESVAWISERKNVLSALFFLLAVAAYGWYAKKRSVARYLPVAACFALGLMAKPQVITLPFALLLIDYWPLQRTPDSSRSSTGLPVVGWSQLILEKVPLFALSAASAWVTMQAQGTAMHLEFPFTVRLENAILAYATYIEKLFWPVGLAPLYPHPGFSIRPSHAIAAGVALAVINIAVAAGRRRYLLAGWLWFLGILVPMIGLVQVGMQAMADRYVYLPAIGIFVIVCWGAADLIEQQASLRIPVYAVSIIAMAALCFACWKQVAYWKDNVTLWTHTLDVTRNNFLAEDSLATALLAEGKMQEASVHFTNAIRINPEDPIGTLNVGTYEQTQGKYGAAIEHYRAVLRFTQNTRLVARALTNLGYAYYSERQLELAQKSFALAVKEMPENSQAWLGLGLIAQKSGDVGRAADDYSNAVRLEPTDVGYLLLAQALDQKGMKAESAAAMSTAQRMSANLDGAKREVQHLLAQ